MKEKRKTHDLHYYEIAFHECRQDLTQPTILANACLDAATTPAIVVHIVQTSLCLVFFDHVSTRLLLNHHKYHTALQVYCATALPKDL